MNFTSVEYTAPEMSQDVSNMISVTFEENDALYRYLLAYIAKNLTSRGSNLYVDVLNSKASSPSEVEHRRIFGRIALKLGSGEYAFRSFNGKVLYALHHMVGKPVGTDCGAKVMRRLNIFSDGTWEELGSFLNEVVEKMTTTEEEKFICYTWKIRYNYWDEEAKVNKRPIDSVVLPSALKSRLINDMTKFLDSKTKSFYLRNGIPYRRSYLFYGIPGSGKTSMVQALAGHFGRNVCFLMPTHPEMTDDSLRSAVNSIPENSIVVFEDIDALFDKGRSNQVKKSSLTFSGLLNALDGIGSANGQVFVLTTNLRENLDHALIRNGRVDLHFEFSFAVPEQMELMWRNFYPDGAHLAQQFASAVSTLLSENQLQVTTSALQHFFVAQMDSTPEEALSNISSIVEEIRANSSQSMLKEATTQSKGERKKGSKQEPKETPMKEETNSSTASTAPISDSAKAEMKSTSAIGKPEEQDYNSNGKKKNKKNKNKNKISSAQDAPQSNEVEQHSEENNTKESPVSENVPSSAPVNADASLANDEGKKKKKKNKKNKNKNKNKISSAQDAPQSNEVEQHSEENNTKESPVSENVPSSAPISTDALIVNMEDKQERSQNDSKKTEAENVSGDKKDETEMKETHSVGGEKLNAEPTEGDGKEEMSHTETTSPITEKVEANSLANDMEPLSKRQHKNRPFKGKKDTHVVDDESKQ